MHLSTEEPKHRARAADGERIGREENGEHVAVDAGDGVDDCDLARAPLALELDTKHALREDVDYQMEQTRMEHDGGDQPPILSSSDIGRDLATHHIQNVTGNVQKSLPAAVAPEQNTESVYRSKI